jgi:hypothetical protein
VDAISQSPRFVSGCSFDQFVLGGFRADEKRTAFMELERAIHEFAVSLIS